MFYLCDLIKRPNTQSAIQGNLHTFRLRIQIVFSLPGRKEEHITKSEIYIFQRQTVCIQFCICICIYIFLHSVLQRKNASRIYLPKKTVSVLWFLKKHAFRKPITSHNKINADNLICLLQQMLKGPFWASFFCKNRVSSVKVEIL